HKNDVLDEHCATIGRDASEIRRSWQFYLKSPEEVSGVRQRIEPYLAIGIDHVCIGMPLGYHPWLIEQLANDVKPLFG
ncbi:MAG: hypothetical protein ABIO92_10045, partial [Chloroflexia bacterium]